MKCITHQTLVPHRERVSDDDISHQAQADLLELVRGKDSPGVAVYYWVTVLAKSFKHEVNDVPDLDNEESDACEVFIVEKVEVLEDVECGVAGDVLLEVEEAGHLHLSDEVPLAQPQEAHSRHHGVDPGCRASQHSAHF